MIDIATASKLRIEDYGIIGIACPAFYLSIPPIMSSFLDCLSSESVKYAFLLVTYGMMQGKSISIMGKKLTKKGFVVFEYITLRMPESLPTFIEKGWTDIESPNTKEMTLLHRFIETVRSAIHLVESGKSPKKKRLSDGLLNSLIPIPPRSKTMKQFGNLVVDEQACTSCGACIESCVYRAIALDKKPYFDMDKCVACYSCFNKCPQKAISTTNSNITVQYQKPSTNLVEKFL